MFNDISSLRSHLATRRSGKARDMVAPGPDAATLHDIIALALRSPDHGKLAPWRIVTIADDQRDAFARLLKQAWVAENPGAAGMDLSALDQFAHQAPTLLVLISTPVADSKIPLREQQMSAGAVGMNLLHAAHAHGFVGSWLTGWAAYSPAVAEAFGVRAADGATDGIVGYFFIGTAGADLSERPRPEYEDVVSAWDI
ncbi:nitroreductase [Sphingopyxis lindanitolerans]|uniref:Putative NAD(P)H nitroreductase n=1 Tax=Sphingopyxis lindanitolerans TaxID=2054227 RepID=A0A2S8B4S2_9SPHN|nr:nitroreductase [Sphingopyxis lindanitolerans]PQM27328.1 nitroreductase [Sphingopyxis lindanitolerans]